MMVKDIPLDLERKKNIRAIPPSRTNSSPIPGGKELRREGGCPRDMKEPRSWQLVG